MKFRVRLMRQTTKGPRAKEFLTDNLVLQVNYFPTGHVNQGCVRNLNAVIAEDNKLIALPFYNIVLTIVEDDYEIPEPEAPTE